MFAAKIRKKTEQSPILPKKYALLRVFCSYSVQKVLKKTTQKEK